MFSPDLENVAISIETISISCAGSDSILNMPYVLTHAGLPHSKLITLEMILRSTVKPV